MRPAHGHRLPSILALTTLLYLPMPLPAAEDQRERITWDQEEDPSYLLPPEVPKEDDFDRVARCKVVESELGYHMTANAKVNA